MEKHLRHYLEDKRLFRTLVNIRSGLPAVEGYSRFSLATDYFFTRLKHDVSINEYFYMYRLYELKSKARKAYLVNEEIHRMEAALNGVNAIEEYKDKAKFNALFAPFIHRQWLYMPDATYPQFLSFLAEHSPVICKPNDSSMGRGVFKVEPGKLDEVQKRALYDRLVRERYLCEECVVACKEIQSLHPQSLNTIRVVTLNVGQKVSFPWAFLRIGRDGQVVDNGHSGGVLAMIDEKTGLLDTQAISVKGECFVSHPDTGMLLTGSAIPHWDRVKETAINAALHFPKAVITGWDIAVLENGETELIEGNSKPDIDLIQAAYQRGMRKELAEILQKPDNLR